jgi:hypothetical protein
MPSRGLRRTFGALVLSSLFVGLSIGSVQAAGPGGDALNVDFVSKIDAPSVVTNVAVAGSHAYYTDVNNFYVADISNPAVPIVTGQIAFSPYGNYTSDFLVVDGHYAFLADPYAGVVIIDVSNPTAPVQVGQFAVPASGLAVAGSWMYVSVGNTIRVVFVGNHAAPIQVSQLTLDGPVGPIAVSGHQIYVGMGNFGTGLSMQVVDVWNPASPHVIGSYPGLNVIDIKIVGSTAWVVGCLQSGGYYCDNALYSFDVANPATPVLLGSSDPLWQPMGLDVAGGYAYVADQSRGTRIFDIAAKSHPVEVAHYNEMSVWAAWATDVVSAGQYMYVSQGINCLPNCASNGLRILRPVPLVTTITAPVNVYVHGGLPGYGGYMDSTAPTATTNADAKYVDSAGSLTFSGGNPWKGMMGYWSGGAGASSYRLLNNLTDFHVWLGLTNSDDQGTNFDIRVEVRVNGYLPLTVGEEHCIKGVTRNLDKAKEAIVRFASFERLPQNPGDNLAIQIYTRIGTTSSGAFCGGHSNATSLRMYFDSTTRPTRFGYQLAVIAPRQ